MAGVWETAHRLPLLGTGSQPALYAGHRHHQIHTVGAVDLFSLPCLSTSIPPLLPHVHIICAHYRVFSRRADKNYS